MAVVMHLEVVQAVASSQEVGLVTQPLETVALASGGGPFPAS